jgi:hypothetical protein
MIFHNKNTDFCTAEKNERDRYIFFLGNFFAVILQLRKYLAIILLQKAVLI